MSDEPNARSVLLATDELLVERGPDVLVMRTHVPHECVSFAPQGGGLCVTAVVANHGVSSEDLALDVDPLRFLAERHRARVGCGGVAMMTACDLRLAQVAEAKEPGSEASPRAVRAVAVATVGLSNLLRAGDPPGPLAPVNTINTLVWVSAPLSIAARLEALSLVAEARTLAVHEAGLPSRRSGLPGSGTGTDCIALLSPVATVGPHAATGSASLAVPWAGKHTPEGAVIGRAVYGAVAAGVARWRGVHGQHLVAAMRAHFGPRG